MNIPNDFAYHKKQIVLITGFVFLIITTLIFSRNEIAAPKSTKTLSREIHKTKNTSPKQNLFLSTTGEGFLSGKNVYLNPGHGFVYDGGSSFTLQGGFNYNDYDDLSNAESVCNWLARYCKNAGAQVWVVREMDFQTNMVIVDNADGKSRQEIGAYEETGVWLDSPSVGGFSGNFHQGITTWNNGVNPFGLGGNRLCDVSTSETARATWTPNIPVTGYYNVYISYSQDNGRASDAHYIVHHPGGMIDFKINQKYHGKTWVFLGKFYFVAGTHKETGSVALVNDSSENGANISADAIRFGGGMGCISRGGITSGKPRDEEDARYHIQFQGCPKEYYDYQDTPDDKDGWIARVAYAGWQNDSSEVSAYISYHTNMGGGSGSTSYTHNTNPGPDGTTYRDFIHNEIISDIKNGYDSDWFDKGKKNLSFDENNASYLNNEMPIVLLKVLYHDNVYDMTRYSDPKFRRIIGRAIYHGLTKYWAWKFGGQPKFLPEPPFNLRIKNSAQKEITIEWSPSPTDANGVFGDPASSYKVYLSTNGYAFDNGTLVSETKYEKANLEIGRVYYFRVTGVNEGGESFPTETLVVKISPAEISKVLIVNGFDKLDDAIKPVQTVSGQIVCREWLNQMNMQNYIIQYAQALDSYGCCFDSCSKYSIKSGTVNLNNYDHIFWIGGMQCESLTTDPTDDHSFLSEERLAVSNFLSSGGNFFVSGGNIGWDLDRTESSQDEKIFYEGTLKAKYTGNYTGTKRISTASHIFSSISAFTFGSGGDLIYIPRALDSIIANEGSAVVMTYEDGGNAGIQWYSGISKLICLGFPFETIDSSQIGNQIIEKVCIWFETGDGAGGQIEPTPSPSPTPSPTPIEQIVEMDDIIEHLLGKNVLPPEKIPFADKNNDQKIDIGDVIFLLKQ